MKKRRHRLERVARWGCTVLVVLLAALWWFTLRRELFIMTPEWSPGHFAVLQVRQSKAYLDCELQGSHNASAGWQVSLTTNNSTGKTDWVRRWAPDIRRGPNYVGLFLPLWLPTLACAGTGTALWRRLLRVRSAMRIGHVCFECFYPRLGLAHDAPCPECGALPTPGAPR